MAPSLHAGLIERARPRALAPSGRELGSVVELYVPTPPSSVLEPVRPATIPNRPVLGATERPRRRFGLTVRVQAETRAALDRMRTDTGQTFQQILTRAVIRYLDK